MPSRATRAADVDQYLADAAAERGRLEAAIVAARERQRGAQAALAGSVDTTNIVHTALLEIQRELAARRIVVDREAEAIVAAARNEAASILRAARVRRAHAAAGDAAVRAPDREWCRGPRGRTAGRAACRVGSGPAADPARPLGVRVGARHHHRRRLRNRRRRPTSI